MSNKKLKYITVLSTILIVIMVGVITTLSIKTYDDNHYTIEESISDADKKFDVYSDVQLEEDYQHCINHEYWNYNLSDNKCEDIINEYESTSLTLVILIISIVLIASFLGYFTYHNKK